MQLGEEQRDVAGEPVAGILVQPCIAVAVECLAWQLAMQGKERRSLVYRHVRHRHGEFRPDRGEKRRLPPQGLMSLRTLGKFRDEAPTYIDSEAVPAAPGDGERQAG